MDNTAQEPVGYLQEESPNGKGFFATYLPMKDMKNKPLYIHHHQFIGLTDDEVDDFMFQSCDAENGYSITDLIRLVEQAIAKKNGFEVNDAAT